MAFSLYEDPGSAPQLFPTVGWGAEMPPEGPQAPPESTFSWKSLLPYGAAGFAGLGSLFNFLQTQERGRQLESLRRYYGDPNAVNARAAQYMGAMTPAAEARLSRLVGNAATRGWSGYPQGLANLTATSYAPYQLEALRAARGYGTDVGPFLTPMAGPGANPFDALIRAMMAMREMESPPGGDFAALSRLLGEGY